MKLGAVASAKRLLEIHKTFLKDAERKKLPNRHLPLRLFGSKTEQEGGQRRTGHQAAAWPRLNMSESRSCYRRNQKNMTYELEGNEEGGKVCACDVVIILNAGTRV